MKITLMHTHCNSCFSTTCSFQDCQIVVCPRCCVHLHQCKLEDHENVCRKALVNCCNLKYGCSKKMLREHLGQHLQNCLASVIVCTREWNRKVISQDSKKILKKFGKKGMRATSMESSELDVLFAQRDQNLICESYEKSRAERVRRRDFHHPSHPLLPLREVPGEENCDVMKYTSADDSSEDERREKKKKQKKLRQVFAYCRMCQIDPSSQHLHTLGNGLPISTGENKRITKAVVDSFHEKRGLLIDLNVDHMPEIVVKGENLRENRKFNRIYTFRCLKPVRRSLAANHHLTQHVLSEQNINSFQTRCPNFSRGCDFTTSLLRSPDSELRYLSSTDGFVFANTSRVPSTSKLCYLENLPDDMFYYLCNFLPSSSVFNLSLTSRTLREKIFSLSNMSCYIDIEWTKDGKGRWTQKMPTLKLSIGDPPPKLEWNSSGTLCQHLQDCNFFDRAIHSDHKISVFPRELLILLSNNTTR